MTFFSSANVLKETSASLSGVAEAGSPRLVRLWLLGLAALIMAMVVVGGATRLTGSGLSITEWQPILGALPPMNEDAWQDAFAKYRQIPQYEHVNQGMSLAAFKAIYWWEWAHRLLGRLIGVYFFIPFIVFIWRGQIRRAQLFKIGVLFVLGGAQGALGWFMVKSGLADRVEVSQYRLAAHLALAVAIAGYAWWLALTLGQAQNKDKQARLTHFVAFSIVALVYLQIILGAFVAGLHGGLASNTWPLMNETTMVPEGAFALSPWYMNVFENPLGAQLFHRLLAYLVAAVVFGEALRLWVLARVSEARLSILWLALGIFAQIALGIATILYEVPIALALLHQANAILVFALALWHVRRS